MKGVHCKKDQPLHRVSDVSQDGSKAKQFLPFLQRAGKMVALVEFVASGSRLRLYLPKDTCLISFILAGVSCPRAPNTRDGSSGEPCGKEALDFTKELVMHREVEVEVEQSDKGGNFIGWLYFEGKNLSLSLVSEGLSKVLPQAERSSHGRDLFDTEEKARTARKKLWKDYVEPIAVENEPEDPETPTTPTKKSSEDTPSAPPDRKTNFHKVVVTEINSCTTFWAQEMEKGPKLDQLMTQLASDLQANPPLVGSFKPTKGTIFIAKFTDGCWYRAKAERFEGSKVHVIYVDYGNRGVVPISDTAKAPSGYTESAPFAKEYTLACCLPPNEDFVQDAVQTLAQEVLDKVVYMNVEYRALSQEHVTLQYSLDDNQDIIAKLISEGLLRSERRRERKLTKLISGYQKAEEKARKERCGMWCYGDATPDDAREFGYQK